MKKTLLSVLGLLFVLPFSFLGQSLLITEVVDGTGSGGYPKYVELTNSSENAINLMGYKLNKFTNANTTATLGHEFTSAYSLPAKASIVITNIDNQTSGQLWSDFSLSEPTHVIYSATNVNGNGDDTYVLVDPSDAQVDIYGAIGTDGTDEVWEYLDSYAFRKASIVNPNTTFTSTEWTIPGKNILDGKSADLSTYLTPGTHTFSTVTGSLELTSPNGGENYDAGDIVKLMWNSTDVANVYFEVYNDDMEWSSITGNIVSADGANEYDFTIPANAFTWNGYKLRVVDADNASTLDESDAAFSIDGHDKQLLWEDFNGSQFNVSAQFSVTGDDKVWTANDGFARMNGYDNTNQEAQEDWLITNAIDLNTTHSELLDFSTSLQYPADDSDLKVYYSSDYVPANDPNNYVWTELSAIFATGASYSHSGYIDISAINGDVYFGFKYTSTATEAEWWQIKDINISGVNNDQSGPTNIEASEKTVIKVGPNPFTYELTIEGDKDINRVLLFNTTGQLVKNCVDFNGTIETAELPSGMYILQIEFSDATTATQKVIKK